MRFLLLGSAALMLSGCSFLGTGGVPTNIPSVPQAGALGQIGAINHASGAINQARTYGQAAALGQSAFGQVDRLGQYGSVANSAGSVSQAQTYNQPHPYYNQQQTNYRQPHPYYNQQQAVQPAAASRCHTGNCLSRWNLEGGIGPVFPLGKNIITSGRTNNVDGTDFNSVSFGDAYETGVRAELGGSYALAPNTKVTLLGHYERADSDGVQDFGTINGQQLSGALSDYEAFGGEVGLRQYAAPWNVPVVNSIRPYAEGRVGVSRVSNIDLKPATIGDAPFTTVDTPLYKNSWVPTAAGLVGVETPIARYTTLGLETGVRYQGGLKSDTSVLGAGTVLGGLNNNRGRVTIPLTLRGRYRF